MNVPLNTTVFLLSLVEGQLPQCRHSSFRLDTQCRPSQSGSVDRSAISSCLVDSHAARVLGILFTPSQCAFDSKAEASMQKSACVLTCGRAVQPITVRLATDDCRSCCPVCRRRARRLPRTFSPRQVPSLASVSMANDRIRAKRRRPVHVILQLRGSAKYDPLWYWSSKCISLDLHTGWHDAPHRSEPARARRPPAGWRQMQ